MDWFLAHNLKALSQYDLSFEASVSNVSSLYRGISNPKRTACGFALQGFAFISFHRREDAARAIAGVSGFGYDHLILNVEWAK